jgi:hypothetical protein
MPTARRAGLLAEFPSSTFLIVPFILIGDARLALRL